MSDPTSTSTLQQLVPYLLPERGQAGSTLTAPTDLAAVLVHAIHTSLEFRLVRPATPSGSRNQSADTEEQDEDEDERQQQRGEDTEDTISETETAVNAEDDDQATQGQSSSSSLDTRFVRLATEARLPSGWSDRGEDSYTFTYKHEQSGLSFIVRVGRMGGRVNVSGMAEDGEPRQISTILSELVAPDFLPWPRSDDPSSPTNRGVQSGVVSDNKLKEFVDKYKKEVIAKLIPGLTIAGYTEPGGSDGQTNSTSTPRANPNPYNNPRPDPSYGNRDRMHDDPYNPSVGHRDLDPLAAFQPPGMGGRLGPFGPGSGMGGDGGGMLVDFDHPMFRGRRDDGREHGPGGMINPPGARWDPVGPGFPGGPSGGGGMGGLGGGYGGVRGGRTPGEPDFDELLPPGENGPDLRQPGGRGGLGGPRGGPGFGGGGFGGGMGGGFGGGLGGGLGGRGGGGGGFGGGGMFM